MIVSCDIINENDNIVNSQQSTTTSTLKVSSTTSIPIATTTSTSTTTTLPNIIITIEDAQKMLSNLDLYND